MFCSKCGNKFDNDAIFCSKCGNNVNSIEEPKNDAPVSSNITITNDLEAKKTGIPSSLLQCDVLKTEGEIAKFSNELGEIIVTVLKTGKGKGEKFHYCSSATLIDSDVFMTAIKTAKYTQTASDKNNELIGTASCNTGLQRMVKTIITIKTKDNETFVFEEKVNLLKMISKVSAIRFNKQRTGDMIIRKGNDIIGEINSIHVSGKVYNTYLIKNCKSLSEKIDKRLLVLGMTVKKLSIR